MALNPRAVSWRTEVDTLTVLLSQMQFTDRDRQALETDAAFQRWRDLTLELRRREGTIYLIGNGASASMASHFAADLAKNGHLHTQVFSDLSLLTAISNDVSYEDIFVIPLQRRGREGDMLISISSSGCSPNILKATRLARELDMTIVTLTGFSPDNPLRRIGDLNAYVAGTSYGHTETSHAAILHHWMDLVEVKS